MSNYFLVLLVFLTTTITCYAQPDRNKIIISDDLYIIPLTENVYQHVSDLETESFGRVECNGLIYINGHEAIICDTPPTDTLAVQLLAWIKKNHSDVKIKAIIVNHFHADCLGGLRAFHNAGIKSYAHALTPQLLKEKKETFDVPQILFSTSLEIKVGDKEVINYYFGEAHTRDNIITWIPSENTIFGGCMVKSVNATKGNLADANVKEWSNTVTRIKAKFPTTKLVVAGHGKTGGTELLDYTIKLFDADKQQK